MNIKFAVLLFVLLFSCSERKGELPVIDIRKDTVTQANLSEIADTVIAIPLETRDDCLLFNSFVLLRDDSLLFIQNLDIRRDDILLFNTNGKFIKQLTRNGSGPGDTKVYGFDLDRERKEIVVNGAGRKIFRYKYDGTFISASSLTLESFSFRPIIFYRNSIWAVGASRTPGNASWIVSMETEKGIQDSIKLFTPEMPKVLYSVYLENSFSVVDNQLYVNHPSHRSDLIRRDTLYRIENGTLHPVLRVDFGNYPYLSSTNAFKTGYPLSPSQIRMNKRFLMTSYHLDNDNQPGADFYIFYYDMLSGKKYHLKNGFDDDLFHTGKVSPKSMDVYHSEFYYIKSTDDLIGTAFERDESDNPVVFIVRLKE